MVPSIYHSWYYTAVVGQLKKESQPFYVDFDWDLSLLIMQFRGFLLILDFSSTNNTLWAHFVN